MISLVVLALAVVVKLRSSNNDEQYCCSESLLHNFFLLSSMWIWIQGAFSCNWEIYYIILRPDILQKNLQNLSNLELWAYHLQLLFKLAASVTKSTDEKANVCKDQGLQPAC